VNDVLDREQDKRIRSKLIALSRPARSNLNLR
jgi:hypothetical protein